MTTETAIPSYSHRQKSPLCVLVYGTAIAVIVGAWSARHEYPIALILCGSGTLTFVLATAFHHLTVEGHGDRLTIRFGPLPLFLRKVRYADIEKVDVGRTLLLDG